MAATKLTPVALTWNTFSDAIAANTAIDATAGAYFDMTEKGTYLIVAENADATNAWDITIKKGNGIWGTADNLQELAKASTRWIVIESGRYKNVSGTNKDKVIITTEATAEANVKCSVYIIP